MVDGPESMEPYLKANPKSSRQFRLLNPAVLQSRNLLFLSLHRAWVHLPVWNLDAYISIWREFEMRARFERNTQVLLLWGTFFFVWEQRVDLLNYRTPRWDRCCWGFFWYLSIWWCCCFCSCGGLGFSFRVVRWTFLPIMRSTFDFVSADRLDRYVLAINLTVAAEDVSKLTASYFGL